MAVENGVGLWPFSRRALPRFWAGMEGDGWPPARSPSVTSRSAHARALGVGPAPRYGVIQLRETLSMASSLTVSP
jgi:hypothetical protein